MRTSMSYVCVQAGAFSSSALSPAVGGASFPPSVPPSEPRGSTTLTMSSTAQTALVGLNMPKLILPNVYRLRPASSSGSFPGKGGVVIDRHLPRLASASRAGDHSGEASPSSSARSFAASSTRTSSASFTSGWAPSPSCLRRRRLKASFASDFVAAPVVMEGGDDLSPLFAHPYGVLPHGNVHASSSGDAVRTRGLGPHLRRLNDEQISTVLSYVDGPSLGRGVAIASRFLYVFGHQDELWRDLTLRRWGELGFEVPPLAPPPKSVDCDREDNGGGEGGSWSSACWKEIYAFNHLLDAGRLEESRRRHIPLRVAGVYSDVLFRPFLCRSFALRPSWLSVHTVPTLDREEVTTERATSGAAPLPAKFGMEDYMNYCARSAEEAPLYLFDRTFASQCPELLEDWDCALRKSCPWWAPGNKEAGHDLFGVLGEGRRPDHQWLIVGPKRCVAASFALVTAAASFSICFKRWIFYPPGASPPGVHPSPSGDDVCMPISLGEWFLSYWDSHVARRSDADPRRRPLECTSRPGDVLFVPHAWWHMVLHLGDEDDGGDVGDSGDRSCRVESVGREA
ncbi:hypothetical protein ACHAWF_013894 [Thalassiosira exigua]